MTETVKRAINLITLLREKEAAEVMGFANQTLRNMRSQKRGPAYIKLGRSVRYDPVDLANYMNNRRVVVE